MRICERCGRSEEEVRLFDAIYGNESIICCERCSLIDNILLLKRPSVNQLKDSEKSYSVSKRLKILANLDKEKKKEKSVYDELKELEEKPELEKPESPKVNLIDNFYWYIQRVRRSKKLTQKQLAENLGESETAIKMIEAGNLPEDYEKLIRKLEQFFQMNLIKSAKFEPEIKKSLIFQPISSMREEPEVEEVIDISESEDKIVEEKSEEKVEEKKVEPMRILDFKSKDLDTLTISDLRKIKEKRDVLEPEHEFGVGQDEIMKPEKEEKKEDYSKKTPTIAELIEKKKIEEVDKLVGDEIEIDD